MSLKSKLSGWWTSFREKVSELKARRRIWRILINKYAIVTLIFLVWIIFFDTNNLGVWVRTNRTLRHQETRIEELEQKISETEARINQLTSERDSLEKFAREQYLFHEKDEDVYLLK